MYKLTLTPFGVAVATAIGRRFGPSLGGWVAGIPFTSAPVAIFVTLEHGVLFGTITAASILAATASQAVFALFYSVVALRFRWPLALAAASAGFAGATEGLAQLQPPPVAALEIAIGSIALALSLMPRPRPAGRATQVIAAPPLPPSVDVALRAVVATVIVVVITTLSLRLGPTLAGLLAPLPVFGGVLIVFPHAQLGTPAAISACRGFLWGLFAAAAFAFTLAQLLPNIGLAAAMAVALVAALVVQGATLLVLQQGRATRR